MITYVQRVVLFSLFLAGMIVSGIAQPARAAGESYNLTPTPSRILESASSGVSIVVYVGNAMFSSLGTPYAFSWSVIDPSGASQSATSNILSTSSSWSFSVNYPTSFTGANLNLQGVYVVRVSETLPVSTANVVNGSFTVALTAAPNYQRTYPVQVQAGGYLPTDSVNITMIRSGDLASTFATTAVADSNGLVLASWQTLPGTSTGSYIVSFAGKNTPPKNIPDVQQFIVYPTNITVLAFATDRITLERSETQVFDFNATYLNGFPLAQRSYTILLTEPDGKITHLASASFNSTRGEFEGIFVIPITAQTGSWNATILPRSLDDSYGNGGPLGPAVIAFSVDPATLIVTLSSSNRVLSAGDSLIIQAKVVDPSGTTFMNGMVQATMMMSGKSVGAATSLTYDPTREEWIGSYQVASSDPSGLWLVTVSASDSYGNLGQSSVTETINVPGLVQSSPTLLWIFVVIILVIVVSGFIMLITRRMGSSRREVKLDLQAIKTQADTVKQDDFLQSIHEQLQRKKREVGLEKPDP